MQHCVKTLRMLINTRATDLVEIKQQISASKETPLCAEIHRYFASEQGLPLHP